MATDISASAGNDYGLWPDPVIRALKVPPPIHVSEVTSCWLLSSWTLLALGGSCAGSAASLLLFTAHAAPHHMRNRTVSLTLRFRPFFFNKKQKASI